VSRVEAAVSPRMQDTTLVSRCLDNDATFFGRHVYIKGLSCEGSLAFPWRNGRFEIPLTYLRHSIPKLFLQNLFSTRMLFAPRLSPKKKV
jgi:hypothetical protein